MELLKNNFNFCQSSNKASSTRIINVMDFPDLLTAQPESCSGQSSVSSRRHAAAYRHWSSSPLAPASASGHSLMLSKVSNQFNVKTLYKKTVYKCWDISKKRELGVSLRTPVCYCWTYPKEALCVLCVPVVVFTNSPQQNLPIGCPGLAKLPNSISFLWESDGLASWYSDRREAETFETERRWCAWRAARGELSYADDEKMYSNTKKVNISDTRTHRCPRPPPPCRWRLGSSEGRWRTEPT